MAFALQWMQSDKDAVSVHDATTNTHYGKCELRVAVTRDLNFASIREFTCDMDLPDYWSFDQVLLVRDACMDGDTIRFADDNELLAIPNAAGGGMDPVYLDIDVVNTSGQKSKERVCYIPVFAQVMLNNGEGLPVVDDEQKDPVGRLGLTGPPGVGGRLSQVYGNDCLEFAISLSTGGAHTQDPYYKAVENGPDIYLAGTGLKVNLSKSAARDTYVEMLKRASKRDIKYDDEADPKAGQIMFSFPDPTKKYIPRGFEGLANYHAAYVLHRGMDFIITVEASAGSKNSFPLLSLYTIGTDNKWVGGGYTYVHTFHSGYMESTRADGKVHTFEGHTYVVCTTADRLADKAPGRRGVAVRRSVKDAKRLVRDTTGRGGSTGVYGGFAPRNTSGY